MPYTLSFVIRKRQQIDNLNELPKSKRPDDKTLWDGSSSELEAWLERVTGNKESSGSDTIIIRDVEIEG